MLNRVWRISADHCIYMRNHHEWIFNRHRSMLTIGPRLAVTRPEMAKLKEQLRKFFGLVDLSELKWLLGVAVTRNRCTRTISLSQAAYIESIANVYPRRRASVTTPLIHMSFFSKDHGPKDEEGKLRMKKNPYLTTIGSIMYAATVTRPERLICSTTSQPVQFQSWLFSLTVAQTWLYDIYMLLETGLSCSVDPKSAHRMGRL